MRRSLAALALVAALAAVAATVPAASAAPAHKCSSGYRHAIIQGAHKCLHSGQICKRSLNRVYKRYGFVCKRGSDGKPRLFKL